MIRKKIIGIGFDECLVGLGKTLRACFSIIMRFSNEKVTSIEYYLPETYWYYYMLSVFRLVCRPKTNPSPFPHQLVIPALLYNSLQDLLLEKQLFQQYAQESQIFLRELLKVFFRRLSLLSYLSQ